MGMLLYACLKNKTSINKYISKNNKLNYHKNKISNLKHMDTKSYKLFLKSDSLLFDSMQLLNNNNYYSCKICKKNFKDSISYLRHIDGRVHKYNVGIKKRYHTINIQKIKQLVNHEIRRKIRSSRNK